MNSLALVLTVFVACAVEAVEALTIVLAAGLTREWRSTFQGMAAALVVLAVVVAVVGPALTLFPLAPLRLIVGALLAVFGLQWLRKAILRASGYKDLHDEEGIYAAPGRGGRAASGGGRGWVHDWYAFTLSFKGVLLEGLEVVFIAITFGDSQDNIGLAALSAAAAVLVVAVVGGRCRAAGPGPGEHHEVRRRHHADLVRMFWGAEGAGCPGPGTTRHCWCSCPWSCWWRSATWRCCAGPAALAPAGREGGGPVSRWLRSFGAFWYDFVIGDDWRGAAVVAAALAATALLVHVAGVNAWWLMPVCVVAALGWSLRRATTGRPAAPPPGYEPAPRCP